MLISVSHDTVVSNKHEERTRHYYVNFQQAVSWIACHFYCSLDPVNVWSVAFEPRESQDKCVLSQVCYFCRDLLTMFLEFDNQFHCVGNTSSRVLRSIYVVHRNWVS